LKKIYPGHDDLVQALTNMRCTQQFHLEQRLKQSVKKGEYFEFHQGDDFDLVPETDVLVKQIKQICFDLAPNDKYGVQFC